MEVDFERNRRAWDAWSDEYQALHGAQLAANPTAWGVWSLPESELAFSLEHPLHAVCWDDAADAPSAALQRPYFELDRVDDDGPGPVAGPVSFYGRSRRTSRCCWPTGSRWNGCWNRARRPTRRPATATSPAWPGAGPIRPS